MNKKLLTLLGIIFVTVLVCTGCKNNLIAEYELPNNTTVRLYEDGKCEYEEVHTYQTFTGNKVYYYDYDYSPKASLNTTTTTLTYTGKYTRKNNTYSLVFDCEKLKRSTVNDDDIGVIITDLTSYGSSLSEINLTYSMEVAKFFDCDYSFDTITFNRTGYELEIELDDNGQIAKHIKKYPFEWIYIGAATSPTRYDEYLYYYDENGDLDHYVSSTNNSISQNENKNYYTHNKYGDIIAMTLTDKTKYEYEYYDDGSKKSEARYFLGEMQEKTEYFPEGEISSMYKYTVDSGYLYEHNRESKQIKRTSYDKNKNISSVSIYEYNDNGLLVAKKTQSSPYGEFEVVNYTYNIKKYLNGNVKLAEMYVDGVIKSHREYYRSGAAKAELIYENGVLQSKKTYNKNNGTGTTYTYTDGQLTYVSFNEIDSDGLSITKSGPNEDSILEITKFNPIISETVQTLTRNSPDEEFTVTDNCETTYDWKTSTTTIKFFSIRGKDYPTSIYTLDKDSKLISLDGYEYDNEVGTYLRSKNRAEVLDKDTVTLEFYNSSNKLVHKLYFHASNSGITIEVELISQETTN